LSRGTLILVVGPSGAGKDSIIAGAAELLAGQSRLVFARRLITRPVSGSGENHIEISPAEFEELRRRRGFMLSWQAHGLGYGLPRCFTDALDCGRCVVANVSRTVIDEARRDWAPVAVVAVTAAPAVLALRLAARGRESLGNIESRLGRASAVTLHDADFLVDNNGELSTAVDRFAAILQSLIQGTPAAMRG